MTYPQPDANSYASQGYQFFPLNTLLVSPGDIYQSEQSGHAFAVGPDSDIANVNVAYFDQQVPTFMQRVVVAPGRAFVGRIDARNDMRYAPAQRPAKIFFWSDDLFDPNYRPIDLPAAFDPATDAISFVQPRLSVIEYFKPITSLGPGRIDKEFVFQNYAAPTGTFFLVVPYYGRKYCYVQFTNKDGALANDFGIVGVNYAITQDLQPTPAYHQETTILAVASVASGDSVTRIITAGGDGMFDALVFSLTLAGPAPLRIIMSDNPAGGT